MPPALTARPLAPCDPRSASPKCASRRPSGAISTIRWLPVSATYTLPRAPTASPAGRLSVGRERAAPSTVQPPAAAGIPVAAAVSGPGGKCACGQQSQQPRMGISPPLGASYRHNVSVPCFRDREVSRTILARLPALGLCNAGRPGTLARPTDSVGSGGGGRHRVRERGSGEAWCEGDGVGRRRGGGPLRLRRGPDPTGVWVWPYRNWSRFDPSGIGGGPIVAGVAYRGGMRGGAQDAVS